MSEAVLDASVLLALIREEPYRRETLDVLEGAVMSTVNYAEVWTKLYELGPSKFSSARAFFFLLDRVEPFTLSQAQLAARLRLTTRHAGLSVADRACLALAIELGAEVYTADRPWAGVDVGCRIHLIR